MPLGFFCPNTPMATDAGLEPWRAEGHGEGAGGVRDAGYSGEQAVMLVSTDYAWFRASATVAADTMKQVGMNVEVYAVEIGQPCCSAASARGRSGQGRVERLHHRLGRR